MAPTRLCIFDDGRGRFGPLTRLRAAFSIRTGAIHNRGRLEAALGVRASDLSVHADVQAIYAEHETDASVGSPLKRESDILFHARDTSGAWRPVTVPGDREVLLVNGRWTGVGEPSPEDVLALRAGRAIAQADGQLIAARYPVDDAQACLDQWFEPGESDVKLPRNVLLERPWHILDQLETTLTHDLKRLERRILGDVHPSAIVDESLGPVVVDRHATVGALTVLEGPCYVGPHAAVKPHTSIRPNTVVGPMCKVAGEISFSVIDKYSNKAHAGYLGHALVGRWVNLGADTTVSNLKNTYGPVRVQLDAEQPAEDTGRTFCGPVIGDYVRTAIGTRIATGAVIDAGAMFAGSGFVPRYVPVCSFVTDAGMQPYEKDKLIATVREMMARRDVAVTDALEAALRTL